MKKILVAAVLSFILLGGCSSKTGLLPEDQLPPMGLTELRSAGPVASRALDVTDPGDGLGRFLTGGGFDHGALVAQDLVTGEWKYIGESLNSSSNVLVPAEGIVVGPEANYINLFSPQPLFTVNQILEDILEDPEIIYDAAGNVVEAYDYVYTVTEIHHFDFCISYDDTGLNYQRFLVAPRNQVYDDDIYNWGLDAGTLAASIRVVPIDSDGNELITMSTPWNTPDKKHIYTFKFNPDAWDSSQKCFVGDSSTWLTVVRTIEDVE